MLDGRPYAEIIAEFPSVVSNKQALTRHRAHFVPPEVSGVVDAGKVSDHGAIDLFRQLGVYFAQRALAGRALSLAEARMIQNATQAILGRRMIEDSQEQLKSIEELLARASAETWDA